MRRIVISSASATARSTIFILRSGLTLWPPKESPARAGLSLLGDVVGGPLPTCRGVPQPTSPNLRIRVSLIRQLSARTLCFERPPRHSRATTRPCSRAFLLRCMSQLMALSGHLWRVSRCPLLGVKRTYIGEHQSPKSGSRCRTVAMPGLLIEELKAWRATQAQEPIAPRHSPRSRHSHDTEHASRCRR